MPCLLLCRGALCFTPPSAGPIAPIISFVSASKLRDAPLASTARLLENPALKGSLVSHTPRIFSEQLSEARLITRTAAQHQQQAVAAVAAARCEAGRQHWSFLSTLQQLRQHVSRRRIWRCSRLPAAPAREGCVPAGPLWRVQVGAWRDASSRSWASQCVCHLMPSANAVGQALTAHASSQPCAGHPAQAPGRCCHSPQLCLACRWMVAPSPSMCAAVQPSSSHAQF